MVFFEAVHALINLDFGFFIDITMNNLIWVFMFAALINYFFEKNKVFWFLLWCVEIWVIIDWANFTGMQFTDSNFIALYYITKIALLAIIESIQSLKKYLVLFSTLQGYTAVFLFTFLTG